MKEVRKIGNSANDKIEKVKLAMLAMQRASWEQGVAAQALLELGDDEMVIRMAKGALVRQDKEGRLAVLGHDGGVTDPAASGEAMLHAVKLTGDQKLKEGADRMRKAAHGKVDEFGLVQGVCGSPTFDRPGTATEGQAFFLLMEAAYSTLEA